MKHKQINVSKDVTTVFKWRVGATHLEKNQKNTICERARANFCETEKGGWETHLRYHCSGVTSELQGLLVEVVLGAPAGGWQ